jgi:hypothetical protein
VKPRKAVFALLIASSCDPQPQPLSEDAVLADLVPVIWYLDADEDGHGDPEQHVVRLQQPSGWVSLGDDCDDGDPTVHPDARDWCGDDLDEDCDGHPRSCDEWWEDQADQVLHGEGATDFFGYPVVPLGDLDSDGFADVAVAAIARDLDETHQGSVYLLHGSAQGLESGAETLEQAVRIDGTCANQRAGYYTTSLGDMNADGHRDLLIGDRWGDPEGSLYLFMGPVTHSMAVTDTELVITASVEDSAAFTDVEGVGDVDGDGFDDLLIGCSACDWLGGVDGVSFLVYGPVTASAPMDQIGIAMGGETSSDRAGSVVSAVGDTDGDGLADLAIGAPTYTGVGMYSGAVYLVRGPVDAPLDLADADVKLTGEYMQQTAGASLAGAGDVDGDGLDDLLVGATGDTTAGASGGAVYLVSGTVSGVGSLEQATARFLGLQDEGLGWSVAAAGDPNGDGWQDLLLGSSNNPESVELPSAWLVLGPVSGTLLTAQIELRIRDSEAVEGILMAEGSGDVDGDGFDDIVVGSSGAEAAGAAHLILGHGGL